MFQKKGGGGKSRCWVTSCGRRLHYTPAMVSPLADDQVQLVVPQSVFQNVLDGRTQMLQDQADDGRTAGAAAETHLRAESGGGG